MIVQPIKTKVFSAQENLFDFIITSVKSIPEKSVLVITSKIAALSENRIVKIDNEQQRESIIQEESSIAIQHPYGWLSVVDGLMTGSAGIDKSNVEGNFQVLLPKDSQKTAEVLCAKLKKHFGLTNFGVIISDSRLMPLRKGTLGAAFGYAGFKGLKSYVGSKDLFGRPYERQKLNIADSLATSAVLEMGEGSEQQPLALLSEIQNIEFTDKPVQKSELRVKPDDDIYKYFYHEFE